MYQFTGTKLFLSKEQWDMAGTWLWPATQYCTMFKNSLAWAILVGLGGPHFLITASFPNQIWRRSIPRHMAQFAEILFLEMGVIPCLF
jgi:hypothetical protein